MPHRLRYKLLVLETDAKPRRRYFRQDVEALLRNPPRRRGPVAMFPCFVRPDAIPQYNLPELETVPVVFCTRSFTLILHF